MIEGEVRGGFSPWVFASEVLRVSRKVRMSTLAILSDCARIWRCASRVHKLKLLWGAWMNRIIDIFFRRGRCKTGSKQGVALHVPPCIYKSVKSKLITTSMARDAIHYGKKLGQVAGEGVIISLANKGDGVTTCMI